MIAPNGLAVKPLDIGAVGAVQLTPSRSETASPRSRAEW
jgi:hypothetical protein